MNPVVRRSIAGLCLARDWRSPSRVPTAAPSQAAIPLPHDDPFYTYSGATPLKNVPRGTVLKSRSVSVGVPGTGAGVLPATQLLYRTQDEQGRPTATVTTVVNPTGPLNLGLVAYLSFYDALGDKCSPSYTLQGGDPGAGQRRDGVRRDRAGARPGGAGVRRDRARLRGPGPALGGRPRVRLEHPRRHPRHRELPRHAQHPEGRPVRLLRRLDRRRVGGRARAVVRPRAQHRRHRDRRHPGPPRAQHARTSTAATRGPA